MSHPQSFQFAIHQFYVLSRFSRGLCIVSLLLQLYSRLLLSLVPPLIKQSLSFFLQPYLSFFFHHQGLYLCSLLGVHQQNIINRPLKYMDKAQALMAAKLPHFANSLSPSHTHTYPGTKQLPRKVQVVMAQYLTLEAKC